MPFVAEVSEERVIPEEVPDETDVTCPVCEGTMRPRGPFSDGTARHFYHLTDPQACSGGESDTHRKLKSLAVSALRTRFKDQAEEIGPELPIVVSDTASSVTQRRVDALVRFKQPHDVFGDGLAVEVQYRNEGKDIEATTHDYLSNSVSVYWADPGDFQQDRFSIEYLDDAFEDTNDSAVAFSAVHDTPPPVLGDKGMLNTSQNTETKGGRWSRRDPIPGCRHEFVLGNGTYFCVRCGLELETKVYAEQRNRYIDPSMGWSGDTEIVADTLSVENDYDPPEIKEEGEPPQMHYHNWRGSSEFWNYTKYGCWCGAEMVTKDEKIFIDHGSAREEDDCDHSWEIQGATKECSECGETRKPWDE